MCELLGNTPKEDEVPVEYEDLMTEVQDAISIYNMLQDNWDSFNGNYLGKNLAGISDIFEIAQIEDKLTIFKIIRTLDQERAKLLNKKKPTN